MFQRISLIVLITILLSSFFSPLIVSAEETSWPLKQKESQDFLDIIRKEPLTKANEYFFSQSIYARDFNAPRKTGAVVLVKQVILKEELNYNQYQFDICELKLQTGLKIEYLKQKEDGKR